MAVKNAGTNGILPEKVPKSFEEAIVMTGYGLYHIYILLATGGCLMCVIVETMGAMFILPSAQCDLKLGVTEKGLLACISFLGVMSSSHMWGYLADTRGRKNILVFCLFSSALVSFVCSIIPWAWLYILLRFLNGALIGGSSSIIYAYAGEFHDNRQRPKVISWISSFVSGGQMYIPGMAWVILPQEWIYDIPWLGITFRPWRLLVIVFALPSILVATMLTTLPESPKYLLSQGRKEETLKILKKMFSVNTRRSEEEYRVSEVYFDEVHGPKHDGNEGILASMWKQTVPLFNKKYIAKTILLCYMQFGIFLSASALALWYPEILNSMSSYSYSANISSSDVQLCQSITYDMTENVLQEHPIIWISGNDTTRISKTRIADSDECTDSVDEGIFLTLLVIGSCIGATYILVGFIINHVGKKVLLIIIVSITGISGLLAQYLAGYTIIQTFSGMYLLVSSSIGIVNAFVVDLYPTQIRAMALAVSLMFGRFGAMLGTNVVGTMFYSYCDYLFWFFGANHIILIIVVILLPTGAKKWYLS